MFITAAMLQQMEKAIAPDAEARVYIYPGGFRVCVSWDRGLKALNKQIDYQPLGEATGADKERMQKGWDRLVAKFVEVKEQKK